MASATYDFAQADGAFALSGATKTSYGNPLNVANNAIVVTSGADETAYLLPFVASGLNIGAEADFTITVNYNKSLTLFIGDFGGSSSGPRGYAVCYRDNGGPVLRLFRCTGRYGIDTVTDISVAASVSGKIGIDWVINPGVSTVVRVWFNGAVVHTFTDTVAPVQLSAGTARAGFIQDYTNAGGTLDNFLVTDTYGVDLTAPTVSSTTGTGTSSSTADISAVVNEVADVYFYVSNSATPPSQSNHLNGTGAAAFAVALDVQPGSVSSEVSGLSAGTWYVHVRAIDHSENLNVSGATTSAPFTLSANIKIMGISGSPAMGGGFSATVIDAGSANSATLSRGIYIETLTINSWGGTVQLTRPSILSAKLLPSPVVSGTPVADAVLTLTNAAGQSSIYPVVIPGIPDRQVVNLTSASGVGWITTEQGQSAIAAGDAIIFTPVLSQDGSATAYGFSVNSDGSPSSDSGTPAGTYTVSVRVWDATDGGFGDEEIYTLTNGEVVPVIVAPVLSGATASRGSATRVDWSVSTSFGSGTLRALLSQNAVETAETIKASGAAVPVSGVGQITGYFTATTGQAYYVHFVHVGDMDSAVARTPLVTVAADPVINMPNGTVVNSVGSPISKTYQHFVLLNAAIDIDASLKAGTPIPVVSSGGVTTISNGGGSISVPGATIGNQYTLVMFSGEASNYKSSYVRVAVTAEAG